MKIKFLGTAAAEGVPALFCQCDICKRSRQAGGRNLRTRSQAFIDDSLLIDFPPDTYWHMMNYGIDLSKVEYCLITHSHSDHLYADDLAFRASPYADIIEGPKFFNLYGSEPALMLLCSSPYGDLNANDDDKGVRIWPQEEFEPFWAGDHLITALPANHGTDKPFIYTVTHYGQTLLYAHDTSEFKDSVWEYFEKVKPHFDIVSLDCTSAVRPGVSRSHMTLGSCIKMRQKLLECGYIDEKTVVCLNHFSHNGRATYDDMVKAAEQYGFVVTYDGLTVEV